MPSDSSLSRTYLTPKNNPYESIHQISNDPSVISDRQRRNERLIGYKSDAFKRRVEPLLKITPVRSPSRSLAGNQAHLSRSHAAMDPLDYEDINRPPESSDEENAQDAVPDLFSDEEPRTTKKRKLSTKEPLNTRDINAGSTRRSKRRKGSNEPTFSSTMPEQQSEPARKDEDVDRLIFSQGSKPRKTFSQRDRGSQNSFLAPSSAAEAKKGRAKLKPVSREATPISESRISKNAGSSIKQISSSPSIPSQSSQRTKPKLIETSPVEQEPILPTVFQPIERSDSEEEPTSRKTSGSLRSDIFDKTKKQRDRRGSSSSLSSTDSLVEYQLDASQKAALMSDKNDTSTIQGQVNSTGLSRDQVVCPCCRRSTSLQNLPGYSLSTRPLMLPLREQTKFCFDHRIRDARLVWKERHYPNIDWNILPTSPSLITHIKSLVPIIRRKSPSHYLSILDNAISAARGNQTEINRIFDITNVHHGYYGPRGAKIVSKAIMEDADLQKVLSRQFRNDKNMRIAGLGRLTDCVLLPEVLVRMVQEDLVLGSREEAGEQARKILEDSVEIGLLLCADDDEVDGDEEEGDVHEV